MATIIKAPTFSDERGNLTVIDKILPFDVKRVFYIYGVKSKRGGHGHFKSMVALISLNGSIDVFVQTPEKDLNYKLNSPDQVLILDPEDWHEMNNFTDGSTLLVLCSHHFDEDDYFYEPYR